ncbi:MAG: hypothetical protein JOY67_19860 [Hyphomicrobiales bacterium]|nr:hypothetical protein [Hyphomicrobiales bacterium]
MTARAYLASFFAFALSGLALIALVGIVVDGYGIFGTRLIPPSRFPPELRLTKHGDRITKAIEIAERQGDRILFIGDSRTQHGLDPDAPALSEVKAYNAALAAASLREQIIALDYALAHEPDIRHIVWGLSFEAFGTLIATSVDYPDSGFAGGSLASGFMHHLLAFDFFASSWKAMLQARHRVHAQMKRNGVTVYEGDPVEGPAVVKLYENELAATGRALHGPIAQEDLDAAHAQLHRRLAELKAKEIDVDLVLLPMHIWRLELFRLVGMEAQIADWKREIARTVDQLAASPGSGQLRLFDFARPHPFTEQSAFAALSPGVRRFFIETSHFYPWLGDKILAKIFDKGADGEVSPFGREIGPLSIDEDVASAKLDLDAWEATHPRDVGYVKEFIPRR